MHQNSVDILYLQLTLEETCEIYKQLTRDKSYWINEKVDQQKCDIKSIHEGTGLPVGPIGAMVYCFKDTPKTRWVEII